MSLDGVISQGIANQVGLHRGAVASQQEGPGSNPGADTDSLHALPVSE